MFNVLPARVLEPLDGELFELVFGNHLESNVNPRGLTPLTRGLTPLSILNNHFLSHCECYF